jgi:nucleotide-binding universal stress UspA family protein
MTYATIIVQADADEDSSARIALAAEMARQFGALLIGVAARDIMPPVTAPYAGPIVVAALLATQEKEIARQLDAAEQQFRAIAAKADQRCSWRSAIDNPAKVFSRESRAADLLVVGRKPESASSRLCTHLDPGDVLLRAGRPVLIVPPGLSHLDAAHVVVAWKDSREARRVLSDALPLLKRATSVLVLEICDTASGQENAEGALRDVAEYLSRQGIVATAETRLLRERSVSAELLLVAEERGAEIIVAGGYAHSRFQEWVFGGLTRAAARPFPQMLPAEPLMPTYESHTHAT